MDDDDDVDYMDNMDLIDNNLRGILMVTEFANSED